MYYGILFNAKPILTKAYLIYADLDVKERGQSAMAGVVHISVSVRDGM